MSEAGAESERYVGVDAVGLVPAGLGSVVALEGGFEESADPAPAAADVAAADPDVKGVHESAAEVALATAALETASMAFDFACTDDLASVGRGACQSVGASACAAVKTLDDHLA